MPTLPPPFLVYTTILPAVLPPPSLPHSPCHWTPPSHSHSHSLSLSLSSSLTLSLDSPLSPNTPAPLPAPPLQADPRRRVLQRVLRLASWAEAGEYRWVGVCKGGAEGMFVNLVNLKLCVVEGGSGGGGRWYCLGPRR